MATQTIPREQFVSHPPHQRTLGGVVAAVSRRVAFWAAVALPAAQISLLFGGLTGVEGYALLFLLGLNVVSLLVGHGHRPR